MLGNYSTNTTFGQVNMSMPSVKIVYPSPGQQITPNNNTLTLRGTSSDNSTSNCEVSIILNNIKPYQPTLPIKEKDYSSWTIDLSQSYIPIKEGQNKATAKISCIATPVNNTKWYSVEFTGIFENSTKNDTIPINKINQEELNHKNNNISNAQITSLNKTNETIDNVSSQISSLIETTVPKQLSIAIQLSKNPISRGSLQTANVRISDSKTSLHIANATVETIVTSPSGKSVKFEHITSSAGNASFSWKVARVSEMGLIHIKVQAFATGYVSNHATASYEVVKNSGPKSLNPFT